MHFLKNYLQKRKYNKEIKKSYKIIKKNDKEIIKNMPKLYMNFTEDEKLVIDTFIRKSKKYCKGKKIVYDLRSKDINLMIDRMQIGRLSLRKKRRKMQILTSQQVYWYDISDVSEAINHIDEWINYLRYLMNK